MPIKTISPRDKNIIYSLYKEGKKQINIAILFEVSQSTISQIIKEMKLQEQIYNLSQGNNREDEDNGNVRIGRRK